MSDSEIHHITIHPVISYPREAEVGKTYLMSIDIQTEYDAETWPYEREDFALHCILDTKPLFNHKAFGEPVIVLNRFGGTYGPATFLLTTATAPQEGAITVTLVNEQGFPLHQMTLPDISVVRETKKPIKTKMLKRNFPIPAPPTEIAHLNKSTAAIQGEDGLIFGTSFLAAQDILFTCAHVVLAAESGPDQMISLRFYGRNEIYRAKVLGVYWSAPEEEDIAVLQLINAPLPDAISPVLVGPSTDCFDHEFISFGYSSKDYTDGLWASGQIRGLINGDGRLQLASKEMHLGMSGAPVVDKESGWVVGMVNAIYRPDNTDINGNTAFAISTERMRRVWPDLPWQTLDGGPDDNLPTFPLVNLPPPNPNFTGRQELLAAIQSSFDNQQSSIAITQAIAGLGGVGKTQLALAFAHQHRDEYDLIWLLRADDPATLDGDLRRLGENLSLPVQNADTEAARQMVLSWLNSTEKRWLLLYDDADWIEPRELSSYLPGGHGHVLITSRRQFEQLSTQTLQLVVFTSKEAAVFLQNRLGTVDSTFEELATELGYLPLALEQAAAFILARQITPVDYLRLFRERRQELLAREQPPEDYHATITTVWEMAFELAGQTPGATELLSLCSFLASDDISLEMIVEHANTLPEALAAVVTDALARGDAVAALTRYSLLTVMDGVLTVHRLVQVMTRDHMERSRTQTWAETAVDLLFEA
ncbi:MAG: trypsin-like peptidase domain-containing protein, partial [Anaerolineales bacterium]|nr:trypsin-like peptidase domain-containing protein [Anaerolineales bacterium]